jgi:hypothetical protein
MGGVESRGGGRWRGEMREREGERRGFFVALGSFSTPGVYV